MANKRLVWQCVAAQGPPNVIQVRVIQSGVNESTWRCSRPTKPSSLRSKGSTHTSFHIHIFVYEGISFCAGSHTDQIAYSTILKDKKYNFTLIQSHEYIFFMSYIFFNLIEIFILNKLLTAHKMHNPDVYNWNIQVSALANLTSTKTKKDISYHIR